MLTLLLLTTLSDDAVLRFDVQRLYVDSYEGCAVADYDNDGDLDVSAGRVWFANPDWTPRPVREIEDWNGYTQSNGEHALDVNEDGLVDIVAGDFLGTEVLWFENPGPDALSRGQQWPRHVLGDTGQSKNEMNILRDLDGDGRPEWIACSWVKTQPFQVCTIQTGEQPSLTKHVLGESGNGHGIAFGDIDNDGHDDILVGTGYYSAPESGQLDDAWSFHGIWPEGHFSCPMFVDDWNNDGRSDLFWAAAHDYGVHLWNGLGKQNGELAFDDQPIDPRTAQLHAMTRVDIDDDGDLDVVAGRRYRAHNGKDPGSSDPLVYVVYRWDGDAFSRHQIAEGVGAGLQIRVADLDDDGDLDIVSSGKDGVEILWQTTGDE